MSLDELRRCAGTILAVERTRSALETKAARLASEREALEHKDFRLTWLRGELNRHDVRAVASYNQQVREHHSAVAKYAERASALERSVTTMNRRVSDFQSKCAGRAYDLTDAVFLKPEEYAAIRSVSGSTPYLRLFTTLSPDK